MGDDASSHIAKATEDGVVNDNKSGSGAAVPSAAETKKLLAARKKSAKNLKAKDTEKKIEALKYCLQDEMFLQEPEVLALVLGFLARVKVPELVLETLKVFVVLLTGVPTSSPGPSTAVEGAHGEAEVKVDIHPEANARYIIEQSVRVESAWKGGEPFIAVLSVNNFSPEIKIKAIEVYRKLLQASATLASSDASHKTALSTFQTCGSPYIALLNLLDAENIDLQFAALSCLATLFKDLLDKSFLDNADNQESTPKYLKFASHAERRFHVPMLAIVESFSLFERGRSILRSNGISDILKAMLVEIASAAGGSSPEEIATIGSNAASISTCFCRVGFAKEVLATSPIDASLREDTVYPVIDAIVSLLQKDVSSALSPPAAVAAAPVATGQQANAAAAAAPVTAVPTPFPTDKCIHIITSLGRMVQLSEKCKSRAKEQGVLSVLLDCFRVSQDHRLHQVVDKLLHLSVELPRTGTQQLCIDPRVFSIVREDVIASGETNDATTGEVASTTSEKAPFVVPESVMALLETLSAMDDKSVQFRLVRWLATVVESPENARALGESSISGFIKILIETSTKNLLLFGFLSKCVMAIASESGGACEVCETENREPTTTLVSFLQSFDSKSQTNGSDTAAQVTDSLAGNGSELCKLEWLNEEQAEAIFDPLSLTHSRHDIDPHLAAVEALDALVRGYTKWNPPTVDPGAATTDFHELILQKLESSSAAAVTAGGPKAGVAAPSKKKIDISKPPLVGEGIACSILERTVDLLQLVPACAVHLPSVSSAVLKLLTKLMKLPGGIKVMLHLVKAAESSPSPSDVDKTTDPLTPPPALHFVEWPLSAAQTQHTEFASVIRPLLYALQSPHSTFLELEASIEAIEVLTSPEFGSSAVVYTNHSSVGDTSVELPITQTDVFINAAATSGALVLLLSYSDGCRLVDFPADQTRRQAFAHKIESLALRLISFGGKLEEAALAKFQAQSQAASEQSQSPPTPSEQTELDTKSKPVPNFLYTSKWVKVLNLSFDVLRFEHSSYPAILLAAELCCNKVALALLSAGASADTASVDGTTPMMMALLTGNGRLTHELLDRNANVDKMTFDSHDLCAWNCALAAPIDKNVSQMITSAYETNCAAQSMSLLVQLDTIWGDPTLLDKFLDAKIDVNVSNADGDFLLHALVSKLLVRKQVRGLDLCLRYHSQQVDKQFVLTTVTELVDKHAADVNACNLLGQSALHLALLFGHADVVKCLLHHGANPNIQDVYGYLPLHYACLGFCSSDDSKAAPGASSIEIIQELLTAGAKFELLTGKHVDRRKHKLPHEKNAIEIEQILDDGYIDTMVPKAITTKVANVKEILSTRGFLDGLLPWHFACGGCSQVMPTLCLDDDMRSRFCGNGEARAAILAHLKVQYAVDLSMKANKGITSLHFALKTDIAGYNTKVLDVLLATESCRAQINDVHEVTLIDQLPPVPEGCQVDVLTASLHAIHCCVSSRSFDSKYHVILPNGHHLETLYREQIQQSDRTSSMYAAGNLKPKYLYLMESAFSPLHYALQSSDDLSQRLLSFADIVTTPEGSDLPLLALACVARRSAQVVEKLINQQANMRVHLPLLGAQRDVIANQIANCNMASRKHASALHYAVLYEDVEVVKALVLKEEHTNVNVRRSGDGFTPLHLACEMSHMEMIRLLLDHGANLLQMSTLSSSANGVTPLQLLLKNDTSENEKLKALVNDKYLRAEMLLEDLGAPVAHRPPATPREQPSFSEIDVSGEEAPLPSTSSPQVLNAAAHQNQDNEITCMLLAMEEFNLELYTRGSQLRESQREGQALSKRLVKDLEKSDDALRLLLQLFTDAPSAFVSVPVYSDSQSPRASNGSESPATRIVTFETLSHRHECYRRKIVRSQWVPPRPPAVMRRPSKSSGEDASPPAKDEPKVVLAALAEADTDTGEDAGSSSARTGSES